MKDKVSIVTPCYNGEKFIDNYMKSILAQDYDNIQLIVVDDGSIDNSLEKLYSYKKILEDNGIEYIILHKENGGQPSAINFGLKKVNGKYITWPDIDDKMHYDYISQKVAYFDKNPEVDFLISKSAIVLLNEPDKILGYTWNRKISSNSDLVIDLLMDRNVWYEPGAFMCKFTSFEKFIPSMQIYEKSGRYTGPQTQMMLPFFYYGKIGYLDECLYDYYIHGNQDHSKYKNRNELQIKLKKISEMLIATIKSLNAPEETEFLELAKKRINRTEICMAFQFSDREWFLNAYKKMKKDEKKFKEYCMYFIMKYKCLRVIYNLYNRLFCNNYVTYKR